MLRHTLIGQRLTALFVLGCLAFNYPLLSLFNGAGTWFGIPRLYAYLFVAWLVLIGLMAFIAEKNSPSKKSVGIDKSTLKD